jgi:hypothetical protein
MSDDKECADTSGIRHNPQVFEHSVVNGDCWTCRWYERGLAAAAGAGAICTCNWAAVYGGTCMACNLPKADTKPVAGVSSHYDWCVRWQYDDPDKCNCDAIQPFAGV